MKMVWRFLGSVHLALLLLVGVAVVLAVGTFVESRQGAPVARELVYGTLWFDALLALIGVNVTIAVVDRWPVPWRKWPFVVTHLAILVLLVGSFVSRHYGIEGQVVVEEGGSTNLLFLYGSELVVEDLDDGRNASHPLPQNLERATLPLALRASAGEALGLPKVVVESSLENAKRIPVLVPDPASERVGLEVQVGMGGASQSFLLVEDDPRFGQVVAGPLEIHYLDARDPELFSRLTEAKSVEPLCLQLSPKEGGASDVRLSLEGVDDTWRETAVPDLRFRILHRFERAVVAGAELRERVEGPPNPAVVAELRRGDQREVHVLFAQYSNFNVVREREPKDGPGLPFEVSLTGGAVPGTRLTLVRGPGESLYAQTAHQGAVSEPTPIRIGEVFTPEPLHLEVEVAQFLPRAGLEQRVEAATGEDARPFLSLSFGEGTDLSPFWLAHGEQRSVVLGEHRYRVGYRRMRQELPFSVTLRSFEAPTHAGSRRVASYESEVEVTILAESTRISTRVSMNRPLDVAGYRLFQSSFQAGAPGTPDTSIFTAARDPGVPVVYASFLVLIVSVGGYVLNTWTARRQRHAAPTEVVQDRKRKSLPRERVPCAALEE